MLHGDYDQIALSHHNNKDNTMQLTELLHAEFKKALPTVHKVRLRSLFAAVETACLTNKRNCSAFSS